MGTICQLNVTNGRTVKYNFKDYISIVIPVENTHHRLVVSRRNVLEEIDWNTKRYRPIADIGREKFNDGKVDVMGRLWIGTLMNNDYNGNEGAISGKGALYRLDGRSLTRMDTYTLPNGMAWNSDNTKFFCAETVERKIFKYDFNVKTGAIYNKEVLLDFSKNGDFRLEELPDGMAMDANDRLWIAIIFGGRIIQIDIRNGKILKSIPTPANQTTSIAFGGPNYKHMYVTTGWRDLTAQQHQQNPDIGKVLRITAPFIQGTGPANRVSLPYH